MKDESREGREDRSSVCFILHPSSFRLLLLPCTRMNAIVLPSTQINKRPSAILAGEPLARWVRGILLVMAIGLVAVFATAIHIDPYNEDGSARFMGTHQKLGLPPCTFSAVTGVPCPSCGMTTSFSLLIRGDVVNSARANWVGSLLAAVCLLLIPWSIASVFLGRAVFLRSLERTLIFGIVALLVLMFLRWGMVLALHWWNGTPFRL
jgi:hypothetical protein